MWQVLSPILIDYFYHQKPFIVYIHLFQNCSVTKVSYCSISAMTAYNWYSARYYYWWSFTWLKNVLVYHKPFLQPLWNEQKDTVLGSKGQRQARNSPVVFSLFFPCPSSTETLPNLLIVSCLMTLEGCHDLIVIAGVWKTASSFVGSLKKRLPFTRF